MEEGLGTVSEYNSSSRREVSGKKNSIPLANGDATGYDFLVTCRCLADLFEQQKYLWAAGNAVGNGIMTNSQQPRAQQ